MLDFARSRRDVVSLLWFLFYLDFGGWVRRIEVTECLDSKPFVALANRRT